MTTSAPKRDRRFKLPEPNLFSGNGWMSPEGELFPCQHFQHAWLAKKLMAAFKLRVEDGYQNEFSILLHHHWLVVRGYNFGPTFDVTAPQLKSLRSYKAIHQLKEDGLFSKGFGFKDIEVFEP